MASYRREAQNHPNPVSNCFYEMCKYKISALSHWSNKYFAYSLLDCPDVRWALRVIFEHQGFLSPNSIVDAVFTQFLSWCWRSLIIIKTSLTCIPVILRSIVTVWMKSQDAPGNGTPPTPTRKLCCNAYPGLVELYTTVPTSVETNDIFASNKMFLNVPFAPTLIARHLEARHNRDRTAPFASSAATGKLQPCVGRVQF